jgi:hypothetical protein
MYPIDRDGPRVSVHRARKRETRHRSRSAIHKVETLNRVGVVRSLAALRIRTRTDSVRRTDAGL